MRPLHAGFAALTILAMAAAIVAGGGGGVRSGETKDVANRPEPAGEIRFDEPATAAIPKTQPAKPAANSTTAPKIEAPPRLRSGGLERIEPRKPLSDLALAMPPRAEMPDDWKGTPLFRPVAPAAGLIEAKGYSVSVAGIDIVAKDETCGGGGKSWACGIRARTAFRAFLRGRAVVCAVPPQGGRDLIAAQCRIGKQDVGAWLVENGWARAVAGGPYAQAGDKARAAKKGIFGEAPDLSGLPPVPAPVAAPPSSSILDLSEEPAMPLIPPAEPATPQVFPPAPAR